MDPIQIEKIQAIKNYKKQQFFSKLIFYFLLTLTCILTFSSFWFPCMTTFLLTSLPKLASFFFSPKFLFIVGNLIVVFLVGESKIFPSSKTSKGTEEVYSNKIIISSWSESHGDLQQTHKDVNFCKMEVKKREKVFVVVEPKKKEKSGGFIYEEDFDEVVDAMPMEEMSLTKRADNYIARVNKQRRLEAKLVMYGDD